MRPATGVGGATPAHVPGNGVPANAPGTRAAAAALLANATNSASNVLVVVLLARATGAQEFGRIALLLTFVPLALVFFRGAVVEPLVALPAQPAVGSARREAAVAGSITGVIVVAAGLLLLGNDMGLVAAALGVGAGVTLVVERDRWSALGGRRPGHAALADASWLTVQAVGLVTAPSSAEVAAVSWAVGGTVAVVVGYLLSRRGEPVALRPRLERGLKPSWGVEYVLAVANLQLALLVLPLTAGVEATGALRASSSILGFTTVLTSAVFQVGMRRMRSLSGADLQHTMKTVSLTSTALMLVATVPLLLLPGELGRVLLGATWEGARGVLPVLLLQKALVTSALGPMIAVRVLDRSEGLIRARALLAIATVVGSLAAGGPFGAVGAAWVMTLVSAAGTVWWFHWASRPTATAERMGT